MVNVWLERGEDCHGAVREDAMIIKRLAVKAQLSRCLRMAKIEIEEHIQLDEDGKNRI